MFPMAVLTVTNLSKAYGVRVLFDGVSFVVNDREKVALIGDNGSGKTTILRIIASEDEADSGAVSLEAGATVGYLPQDVDLPLDAPLILSTACGSDETLALAMELAHVQRSIHANEAHDARLGERYAELSHRYDTLGGFQAEAEAKGILAGLGFTQEDLEKRISTLSGGQKTRAALAKLLLQSPDLLLLDEPTNHLDIDSCEWLQEFLTTRFTGAAVIVSHDRYFMDKVVSRVIELDSGTVESYPGSYAAFADSKTARLAEKERLFKAQKKEIERLEAAIQTLFSHRKFSRRDSKVKQLERLERVDKAHASQTVSISIPPAARGGREVVRLLGVSKSYGSKSLFSDVDYVFERGWKTGVVGPNGSGKTTLLKIVADMEAADTGRSELGFNIKPVYFAQEFDHLDTQRTVLEELLADADISSKQARDLLARFLFLGDDAFKRVEVLSGGEKCRLALAKVLAVGPNLLLLDEPTNHLDIASREALEHALREYHGTAIIASHDRYLLDRVANHIVEIRDGTFQPFLGNYSAYREKAHPATATPRTAPQAYPRSPVEPAKPRPMSTVRELERTIRETSKQCKNLETEIHSAESRISEITQALGQEQTYKDGSARALTSEFETLSERLKSMYAEWESATECVEQLRGQLEDAG